MAGGDQVAQPLCRIRVYLVVVSAHGVPFTDQRQHNPHPNFTQAKYLATNLLRNVNLCAIIRLSIRTNPTTKRKIT